MNPLDLVRLRPLMGRTQGRPDIVVGLIDGPVLMESSAFSPDRIQEIRGGHPAACSYPTSAACLHGTYVAGILASARGSAAPSICPNCTLLVRPIFSETIKGGSDLPNATPTELAQAIIETVNAGARVLNMSVGLTPHSDKDEYKLREALDYAARRGVLIVVAAGNHGIIGGTAITRHTGVIPVVATDLDGRPSRESNLSGSIGLRGLSAPGEGIVSVGLGGPQEVRGTSAAAPFVTGTIALLWSEFPNVSPYEIRMAVTGAGHKQRRGVVPPLLDAWGAWLMMNARKGGAGR